MPDTPQTTSLRAAVSSLCAFALIPRSWLTPGLDGTKSCAARLTTTWSPSTVCKAVLDGTLIGVFAAYVSVGVT